MVRLDRPISKATALSKPLVSVVIPTRDRASLVARAIESALSQSLDDLEVIVVDDGSADDTRQKVANIDDSRVYLETLPSGRGAGAARNAGILRARGAYIALLDSDDQWHPDKLARQYGLYEAGNGHDVVCYTQVWQINETSRRVVPTYEIEDGQSVPTYLFEADGMMQTSTLFLPTALARDVLFDADLSRHQDYDFCVRLEAAGARFRMIKEPLACWYVESDRDRLSSSVDFDASQRWLDAVGSEWDKRTRLGFLLREVMPRYAIADRRRMYTAWLALQGAFHGLLSLRKALRMAARVPFPKWARHTARVLGGRLDPRRRP